MFLVRKGDNTMPVKHKVHLDAFLADGWELVEDKPVEKPEPKTEPTEDYELPRTRSTTRRRSSLSDE